MTDVVAVPFEEFDKLVKRVVRLRYPPSAEWTEEQVARHYRHLELDCQMRPEHLVQDIFELLDRLDGKQAVT